MALPLSIIGAVTGAGADVDVNHNLNVILPGGGAGGGVTVYQENDDGTILGTADLKSNEVDEDYRGRTALDIIMDEENFCYATGQNTGKHTYANTTMTNGWATGAMSTNSGNGVAITTGTKFSTYAYFPVIGANTLSFDIEASFSNQPTTNTVIDFGAFLPGAANPYAPTDGAYFRLTSAGLQGVVNYNGTETSTDPFVSVFHGATWAYTNNKKYQFIIYITPRRVLFWINDNGNVFLYGSINTQVGNGQPCASASLPFAVRHAIVGGAASSIINFQLARYNVRVGGAPRYSTFSTEGNRVLGSYQGQSGGTMGTNALVGGSITTGNAANPSPAVPTTTSAALGSGLGGRFWETATIAVNTDGIVMSYQVPVGTALLPGRRLVLRGIYLSSYIQTIIAGGPATSEWFLAFGHTAVSLATTETAASKAPRRIMLPFHQVITATQAAYTLVSQNTTFCDFGDAPVFVNPGEFVQLCTRRLAAGALTSGVIAHHVTPVYGWE